MFSEDSIAEYFSLPVKRVRAIIRYPLLPGTNTQGTQHDNEASTKPTEPISSGKSPKTYTSKTHCSGKTNTIIHGRISSFLLSREIALLINNILPRITDGFSLLFSFQYFSLNTYGARTLFSLPVR